MIRAAYNLGVKLAMTDAGLVPPAKPRVHPGESLATILQAEPDVEVDTKKEPEEPIGAPKDDYATFGPSYLADDFSGSTRFNTGI